MKCPKFCEVAFIFAVVLLSLSSWAHPHPHPHESFLDCLSLGSESEDFSSFSKLIFTPNNSSYASVLDLTLHNRRFATPTTPKPRVIVTPTHPSQIQPTIYCSIKHGLQLRTRSGGHDYEGVSYASQVPFVILDLINFRSVDIDVENKVAWVQSGAVLGELYYKIAETSGNLLAFPAGLCPTVGIGGFLSGGGYGVLFRKYGIAADNVIDAQLIDVKGRILDRKAMGEDVFWAIRGGGGGSFGIVLAWKINLVSVPPTLTAFTVTRTLEQNATKLVHRWQSVAPKFPDQVSFSFVVLKRAISSNQDGKKKKKTILASFITLFLGGADELVPLMQDRFPELGLVKEDCTEMSWIESALYFAQLQNSSLDVLLDRTLQSPSFMPSFKAKSDFVKEPIPEIAIQGIWSRLYEEDAECAHVLFLAWGGIMDEIAADATPFPHRAGNLYLIFYLMGWNEEDNINSDRYISWTRRLYSYMSPFVSKSPRRAYVNYRDLDIGTNNEGPYTSYQQASAWGRKYFLNNFDKLVRVKTMIDPENFFRHEQSVPPLTAVPAAAAEERQLDPITLVNPF